MCCFSRRVKEVASTNIFARMTGPARQLLVYEMQLAADAEVAMILPIPVPAGVAEDAVRFHSLEHYPRLFEDLDRLFEEFAPRTRGPLLKAKPAPLAVHSVGAFEASFVPALADFDRLDPRFRVPPGTLDQIPDYADWGFAVFQLAPAKQLARVHPMAFEFPTRDPSRLFFPTVHVHDGKLHRKAKFAHRLYAQGLVPQRDWRMSDPGPEALSKIRSEIARPRGVEDVFDLLFDLTGLLLRLEIFGTHPNTDTWAALRHPE